MDKKRRKRFLPATSESDTITPHLDLSVQGTASHIHRNHNVAEALEQGHHLIDWHELHGESRGSSSLHNENDGDEWEYKAVPTKSLWIERHDARTLLDGLSFPQARRQQLNQIDNGIDCSSSGYSTHTFSEVGSKEEIAERNFQRFGLLPEFPSCFLGDKSNKKEICREDIEDAAQNEKKMQGDNRPHENDCDEKPFELSEEEMKKLPNNITALPKTMKQSTIIQHTADRLASSSQSSQLEVFLKVKQNGNPDFLFLYPSNELHRYYLFVKEKLINDNKKDNDACNYKKDDGGSEPGDNGNESGEKSGIAGLLECYSSSDEENTEENEVAEETGKKDSSEINSECIGGALTKKDGGSQNNSMDSNILLKNAESQDSSNGSKSYSHSHKHEVSLEEQKIKAERLERVHRWKESRLCLD